MDKDSFYFCGMEGATGHFRISITVEPKDQPLLFAFAKSFPQKGLPVQGALVCSMHTFYGDHPIQPVFRVRYTAKYFAVMSMMILLEEDMTKKGMTVLRTKIDVCMWTEGIPQEIKGLDYYEVTVHVPVPTCDEWNRLAQESAGFAAHLCFDACDENGLMDPVVTFRRYKTTTETMDSTTRNLLAELRENGFEPGYIRQNYAIWDRNVNLDRGWLFEKDQEKYMFNVPQKIKVG